MNRKRIWIFGFAVVWLALLFIGCEGTLNPDATATDVSGSWLYSDSGNRQTTWALVQTGSGAISGATTDGGSITGELNSATIDLILTYTNTAALTLTGTVDTNVMTGTFTNSTAESGNWTAVKTN